MKKKILLLFSILAMAVSASADNTVISYTASAEVTPKDGTITGASGTLTIVSKNYNSDSKEGTITFSGEVTSIGASAFYNCTGLTSVTIPSSVTSIGVSAFDGCAGLTSVTIPSSVTSIGNYAFFMTGLTSVNIPTSVETIGYQAFGNCSSLSSFTGKFASSDNRCLIKDKQLIAFAPGGLTSYEIPNTVTSIGESAFKAYENLTSITIPNTVTSIGEAAFSECKGLTSIKIPNSVTEIEGYMFAYCTKLTSVVIPSSVDTIGGSAFAYCNNLAEIISLRTTPPGLGNTCFNNVTKTTCKVIVPSTSLSSYNNWGGFTTITDHHTVSTFGENKATLWLSYPVTIPSGIEAYTAKLSAENDKVMLTKINDGIIPAKTGVILKKTGEVSSYDFVIAPNSFDATAETDLLGYAADVTPTDGANYYYYKLTYKDNTNTNFGFYRTQSDETLKANRAYLKLSTSSVIAHAPTRGIGIEWGDEGTTEIESVVEFDTDNGTMYNLQGMPVGNDYKGIVIKNGRKMLNK